MVNKIELSLVYVFLASVLAVFSVPIYLEKLFSTLYYGMLTWRCGKCGLQLLRIPGGKIGQQFEDQINWWTNDTCVYCKRERTDERQSIFDKDFTANFWHAYTSPLETAETQIPQWLKITHN